MDSSSLRVIKTARFEEEVKPLLEASTKSVLAGLVWALTQDPLFGQQVRGSTQRVWVLYHGGYAYLAYYTVSGKTITLESILKRKTPIAPGPLGIEP